MSDIMSFLLRGLPVLFVCSNTPRRYGVHQVVYILAV